MKHKQIMIFLAVCAVLTLFLHASFAAVSAEEAAKLKTTLTPMGAERAGNADGSIPAWTGGYTTVSPGWKTGMVRPDPFANEKPLYSITGQNMDKYADKLSDGQKYLLKKYSEYRLDVYPTHRTLALPQYIYDWTFKNATTAQLKDNGLNLANAYSGAPFPIPKNGNEVMWNLLTAYNGSTIRNGLSSLLVHPNGDIINTVSGTQYVQFAYNMGNTIPYEKWNQDNFQNHFNVMAPPFKAGESIMWRDPMDQYRIGRAAWQYLSGQRRVRRAPAIAYDTPDFISSGQTLFDEAFFFSGSLDRYEWKLLGKKEMIVPYNCNKFNHSKIKDAYMKGHEVPDAMRWELHRVWAVEATLAPGKRHTVPHRIFYIDEDSWHAVLSDGWDAQGKLWRAIIALPELCPDIPALIWYPCLIHLLPEGSYLGWAIWNEQSPAFELMPPRPMEYYSPENLAAMGVR